MDLVLAPDRFFDPDPRQAALAMELYQSVANLPIVSPHGHVDPRMFADPNYRFGSPVDMLIIPDHYVFRMLYSQGIPLETLGIARVDGGPVETDHRAIWQVFAENFSLFRGTPSGIWLAEELYNVFGVREKLNGQTAQAVYDQIAARIVSPEFAPRRLYEQFPIEVLCTTDSATDTLEHHAAIRASGWGGRVLPTFRPDALLNLAAPGWASQVALLSERSGVDVHSFSTFIQALENRRAFFQTMGARATDHGVTIPYTCILDEADLEIIFQRALQGQSSGAETRQFQGHMLVEMARMSVEDGLVMQLHAGPLRNHNTTLFEQFGADKGADIPVSVEFTHNLQPLLAKFGNDPRLTLIVFTLDESPNARELAPLAGHYPAVKLGPPWWFYDSLNGIQRYFETVMETAGLYNTAGFNDDTRAFPSIPARHDLWRRASANWVAGLEARKIIDHQDAQEMVLDLAYRLAKRAYKL